MRIEAGELRDAARGLLDGVGAGEPEALWKAVVEAGWPALTVAEAHGGLEQTTAEAAVLYSEIGRALSGAPLTPSLMAVDVLAACAPSPERDGWLERIAGGEPLAASLVDPSLTSPIGALQLDADDRLSGTLAGVMGSEQAEFVLVLSKAGSLAAIAPLRSSGVEIEPRATWDETRRLADIHFDDVSATSVSLLARGPITDRAIAAGSAHLHLALAADCVGAAAMLLETTVEYLKTRRQFDRPLALFQALKHRCADLKAWVEATNALVMNAAGADRDEWWAAHDAALEAKVLASLTFRKVAEEAVQLHGGIGMTAEHPCHRFLKRALLNEQLGLPDEACARAVGDAVVAWRWAVEQ